MNNILINPVEDPDMDTCVPGLSFLLKASLWPEEAGLADATARGKTLHFSSRWRHLAGYPKRACSGWKKGCVRYSQTAGAQEPPLHHEDAGLAPSPGALERGYLWTPRKSDLYLQVPWKEGKRLCGWACWHGWPMSTAPGPTRILCFPPAAWSSLWNRVKGFLVAKKGNFSPKTLSLHSVTVQFHFLCGCPWDVEDLGINILKYFPKYAHLDLNSYV